MLESPKQGKCSCRAQYVRRALWLVNFHLHHRQLHLSKRNEIKFSSEQIKHQCSPSKVDRYWRTKGWGYSVQNKKRGYLQTPAPPEKIAHVVSDRLARSETGGRRCPDSQNRCCMCLLALSRNSKRRLRVAGVVREAASLLRGCKTRKGWFVGFVSKTKQGAVCERNVCIDLNKDQYYRSSSVVSNK